MFAENAVSRAARVHTPNDFLNAEENPVYRLEQGLPEVLIGQDKHHDLVMSLKLMSLKHELGPSE